MKRLIEVGLPAIATLFLCVGCGQGTSSDRSERSAASGQALEISPGVTVTSASYRIVFPNGQVRPGTVAVGSSPDISVRISGGSSAGVPLGNGYEIDVFATASDGTTECDGFADFNVTATGPLNVPVHLDCGVPSGRIRVTGSTNICAMFDLLEAIPSEVRVGGQVTLHASAHDSDNGPMSLSYWWAANGQLITGQTQPSLVFSCTSVGTVTITASVSDGDLACTDSLTATLTCSPP